MATGRAVLMTVGQLSFYDQVKLFLLRAGFSDNIVTHFLSSLTAVSMIMLGCNIKDNSVQKVPLSHLLSINCRSRFIT
jgi:hypothetical protein